MYTLPVELQKSYLDSANYPENLIPNGIATYKSRLISYRERLDGAETDLCLCPNRDDVEQDFEIPMIDLGTSDGKGKRSSSVFGKNTKDSSAGQEKYTQSSKAHRMARYHQYTEPERP
jgi:hypothetical protein